MIQFWTPSWRQSHGRDMKMVWRVEKIIYKQERRKRGLLRLEKGKLRRHLNAVFHYLRGGFIEVRDRLFSKVGSGKKGTTEEIPTDLKEKNTLL